MKNGIILLMCIICSLFSHLAAQDMVMLTYSDWYTRNSSVESIRLPVLSKEQRVNKSASCIISTNTNLNEQVSKSLEYAISVWEANILDCDTIFIEVKVEDIEEDIRTDVQYFGVNQVYMPWSLYKYKNPDSYHTSYYPDGIITISSNTVWDYSLGENVSADGKNLTYGIMRGIARILGFGSSVALKGSDYFFACKKGYSVFDNLIVNSSGIALSSINVNGGRPNASLKSYINASGETFWLSSDSWKYQLQSPPYSANTPPFAFLNDGNSLMRSDLQIGSYAFQVDEITQTILNELGWNILPAPSVKIISDDIPDTGLASAYESHSFKIEKGILNVQNPKWEFVMPLADGTTQTSVLTDNNLSCIIEPIEDVERYKINQDGDIECALQFSCTINGEVVQAKPFRIYLELKPIIEYAIIENIVDNSPHLSYNAHYKVKYRGADKIHVSIEEEYSSQLRSSFIKEPYIAYGVAEGIMAPYYAWIHFLVENKYGEAQYTIELGPYGEVIEPDDPDNGPTTSEPHLYSNSHDSIGNGDLFEVYDINGIKVGIFNRLSDIDKMSQKGLLFIKQMRGDILVKTLKKMKL